jgi:hypothetical protein
MPIKLLEVSTVMPRPSNGEQTTNNAGTPGYHMEKRNQP